MNKPVKADDFLGLFSAPPEPCPAQQETSSLGEDLGMSFEEFFSTLTDEKTTHSDKPHNSIFDEEFPPIVLETHRKVHREIFQQFEKKDGLKFISDWTGRGKTTGIIKALSHLFKTYPEARVIIATKEISEVDALVRSLQGTMPDVVILPFSHAHREDGTPKEGVTVIRDDVTKEECMAAQIVVSTHSGIKQKDVKHLLEDRDLLLIDEYPEPVDNGRIDLTDLSRCHEDLKYNDDKDLHKAFNSAMKWVANLTTKDNPKVGSVAWIDKLKSFSHGSANINRLITMGEKYRQGKGFLRPNGTSWSLMWSEYELPLEERAIIFSATNAYEGWHIDPSLGEIDKGGVPTDYKNMSVSFKEMPKGIKDTRSNSLLNRSSNKKLILGEIGRYLDGVPEGEKVLLLLPKSLTDWLQQENVFSRFPNVSLINWGRGIGTNSYKDYKHLFVWSLFHIDKNSLAAKAVGHGARMADVTNNNSAVLKQATDYHHHRWVIQMLNRIAIRQMVGNSCIAQGADVVWVTTPKDEKVVTTILDKHFLNVSVEQAERTDAQKVKENMELVLGGFDVNCGELVAAIKRQTGIGFKVTWALSWLKMKTNRQIISSKELTEEFGLDFTQGGTKKKLLEIATTLERTGWVYSPAIHGKPPKPHTWTRT